MKPLVASFCIKSMHLYQTYILTPYTRPLRRTNPDTRKLHCPGSPHQRAQNSQKSTQNRTHLRLPTHHNLQRPSKLEHTQTPSTLLLLRANNHRLLVSALVPLRPRLPTRYKRRRRHCTFLCMHTHTLALGPRHPREHSLCTYQHAPSAAAVS
jgi:hypothetical protein